MKKIIDGFFHWFEHHGRIRAFVVIVLVLLCAFEVSGIYTAIQGDVNNPAHSGYMHGDGDRQQVPHSPSEIQSWMTFSYINFVFKLPPNYLSTALMLTGSHYPEIQIRRYAKMNHVDQDALLKNIRQAVTDYKPS